jgi:hypothetical protein
MPDSALADQLTEVAERLLNATSETYVDGDDVAREAGYDPEDVGLYEAFREIERRGTLKVDGWRGAVNLPGFVGLPG